MALVFFALAVITFLLLSNKDGYGFMQVSTDAVVPRGIAPMPPAQMMESGGGDAGVASSMMAPDYYPYYRGDVPITDTREFLKKDFNAQMRTRDVQGLVRRIETTVRGFDGRIDSTSSSQKYGHVGFVVSASKFEDFRTEVERLVNSRFLSVDISTQNMLSQKQSIEEQQKQSEEYLAELQAERKQMVAAHTSAVRSLQSQIDANANEQAQLRAEITNDPTRQAQIQSRLNTLAAEQSSLKNRLSNENASYANNVDSIDSQIKYADKNVQAVKTQDQRLLDEVATVRGTVSVEWISLWEIVQLYLPGYWMPGILAVLGLLAYFWERRRVS